MSKKFLHTFFQEKNIPYQLFEIADTDGLTHLISTDYVIEAILNTSANEQQAISQTLRKLDFFNQPIGDYLKHLATALVTRYNKAA
jgi:hypothetical protein